MDRPPRRSEIRAKREGLYDGVGSRAGSSWAEIHDRKRPEDVARRQYLDEVIAAQDDAGQRARRRKLQRARYRCAAARANRLTVEVPTDG